MNLLFMAPCYAHPERPEMARRLVHSAKHFGYPDVWLYGLGQGYQGSPHGGDVQGQWVVDILKSGLYPEMDTILCTDCRDVLCTRPCGEMLEVYKSMNSGFVIGCDLEMHPRDEELCEGMLRLKNESGGHYGCLNIGFWIGDRSYAIEVLQKSIDLYRNKIPHSLDSAQAWLAYGLCRNTIDFVLDRNAVLFQPCSSGNTTMLEIIDGRPHNMYTDTWPSLVHFNGCGEGLDAYDALYRKLIQ